MSYFKLLFKNLFWSFFGRAGMRVVPFLLLPVTTAYLDVSDFGYIALFVIESTFISSFFQLGLTNFAGRMIYKFDRRNPRRARQYCGVVLFFIIALTGVGTILLLPLMPLLKRLIFSDAEFPFVWLVYLPLVNSGFRVLLSFTGSTFVAFQKNEKKFYCDLLDNILFVPAQLIGIVYFDFTWIGVVVTRTIVNAIVAVFGLFISREFLAFSRRRLRIFPLALRYSLPLVPRMFVGWFSSFVDRIFLSNMTNVANVGLYSVGMRFSSIYQFYARSVCPVVRTEISKRLDAKQVNVQKDIRNFVDFLFQSSLLFTVAISLFSREFVNLMTGTGFEQSYSVITFLIISVLFAEFMSVFNLKFIYRNKTPVITGLIFCGALLNAIFNYFLIPVWGITGAAAATCLANFCRMIISYFFSQRVDHTDYGFRGKMAGVLIALLVLYYVQDQLPLTMGIFFLKVLAFSVYFAYFLREMRNNERVMQYFRAIMSKMAEWKRQREGASL